MVLIKNDFKKWKDNTERHQGKENQQLIGNICRSDLYKVIGKEAVLI